MTNLVLMMLTLISPMSPGLGAGQRAQQDNGSPVTPVTGMFLIPPKIPDCRTKEEADQALTDKRAGEWEKCDPERYNRAHRE